MMIDKVMASFETAVADVPDGASLMMYNVGAAGTPSNLIRALRDLGVKDLTVISHQFVPAHAGGCLFHQLPVPLTLSGQIRKIITAWPSAAVFGEQTTLEKKIKSGEVEVELTSHGTLAQRVRAGGSGIGGFYSPVGIGTVLEEGKEKRVFDGKEYILEKPLRADFGFVRALKADRFGNLVYRGAGRGANPLIAMACNITIAEVDEIVEAGDLDPESIVTPGIFVKRVVKIPEGGIGGSQYRQNLMRSVFGGGV
ncbi:MAG: CoA transferase subunit A [Chloroflexi bacterium]|nr:CoA transferase subunit A [Chloroflexota bacterium]